MNVLIITVLASHSPSGVVSYYNRLADDLRSQGMTVSVLDSADTPYLWRKCLGLLKRIMTPFGPVSQALFEEFAQFTGAYFTVLGKRQQKPDLIHAQDAKSGAAAFLALNKTVSVVMTCHFNDNPVSELAERFPMSRAFENRFSSWYTYLFSHIKNYVFVSSYAYDRSKHLLPADARRVTIHNTVNLATDTVLPRKDTTNRIVISNVGYVDERKNQKLLILIGGELRRRGINNFAIWIIGDGPQRPACEHLAGSLGLTEHVTFYGRQPDPWRLVAQTDLYIHTALNDNCPYAIIEAFAVETAVLALPVGGIPEMLPTGFGLLHATAVEAITDEVVTYFDADRREALRQAQARYADQHFNHDKSLTELISFYHQTELVA